MINKYEKKDDEDYITFKPKSISTNLKSKPKITPKPNKKLPIIKQAKAQNLANKKEKLKKPGQKSSNISSSVNSQDMGKLKVNLMILK